MITINYMMKPIHDVILLLSTDQVIHVFLLFCIGLSVYYCNHFKGTINIVNELIG